jgi:hypothetical protein
MELWKILRLAYDCELMPHQLNNGQRGATDTLLEGNQWRLEKKLPHFDM